MACLKDICVSKGKKLYEDQKNSRKSGTCVDYLQNVDKIETICESTLHSSNHNKIGAGKTNLIGGFSLAHIKQHLFDTSKHFAHESKSKRKR